MESARNLTSTAAVGIDHGPAFDDKSWIPDIGRDAITKIIFGHSDYIRSLQVHYGDVVVPSRGAGVTGHTQTEIILEPGEFITSFQGNHAGAFSDFRLETNKGKKWGPFGTYNAGTANGAFSRAAPSEDMGLLYLSGKADTSFIRQLTATWAKFPSHKKNMSGVNYEEHSGDQISSHPLVTLSKFARNLMSPVVTLVVGEEGVELHACERILCSLPFFRAAFHGSFREASEKTITMPEDEPEMVSALIEFLYNSKYTYVYDLRTTERPHKDAPPVGDLREGEFHVHVYAIASKYDCQPLVEAAVENFICILLQLKSIDVVRHWKTAYGNGLYLSDWEDNDLLAEFKRGLGGLLRELYVAHREEMDKTFAECPALGTDFLRVAVCNLSLNAA